MRLLVSVRSRGVVRHLGAPLAELEERGAEIVLLVHDGRSADESLAKGQDVSAWEAIVVNSGYGRLGRRFHWNFLDNLRQFRELLLYSHPVFVDSIWLRERASARAPAGVGRTYRRFHTLGSRSQRSALRFLRWLDRACPVGGSTVEQLLSAVQPDLVLGTALCNAGAANSAEIDLLKAASRRGSPTAIIVPSWDNLTTNVALGFIPDRVLVWNEAQVVELERLHAIKERGVATGAPVFDHWDDVEPCERRTFCERIGIDPDRHFALYLGSSAPMVPNEARYFREWLALLRDSDDELLRSLQVLVRPHPTNASVAEWDSARSWIENESDVLVWPEHVSSVWQRDALFAGALAHCVVAIGVNTSAMIDAAVHGAPVRTWLHDAFLSRVAFTPHAAHLLNPETGLSRATADRAEHLLGLAQLVKNPRTRAPDAWSESFVSYFVRPRGVGTRVSSVVADEILALAGRRTDAPVPGRAARTVGRFVALLSFPLGLTFREHRVRTATARAAASAVAGWLTITVGGPMWLQQGRKRIRRSWRGVVRSLRRSPQLSRRLRRIARHRLHRMRRRIGRYLRGVDGPTPTRESPDPGSER